MTTIPMKEVAAFLLGEASLDGYWFGERHPISPFWWREHLRAALSAPATAPEQPASKALQDASLSATTKALTFARTALLVVNSGASQKAIALIDDALNQAPVQAQVLNPLTDDEKIYALWYSSDANDPDDFLDGWRHAEAFHGITGDKQ